MKPLTFLVLATALVTAATHVSRAQDAAIEPTAIAALERMGAYLRSLQAFQVEATTSTEEVLTNGQKVTFYNRTDILARMPDRLRVSIDGDRRNRLYVYDGKEFTVLARGVNYYATVPAPPTIGGLADALHERFDLDMPLEDLFHWGGPQSQTDAITSAMFVGAGPVSGITCAHYAFRQKDLDWEIWIQQGEYPLPRRLILTTTTDAARPQYEATIDWNLAPSYNDAAFTFIPPPGAGRVTLASVPLAPSDSGQQ